MMCYSYFKKNKYILKIYPKIYSSPTFNEFNTLLPVKLLRLCNTMYIGNIYTYRYTCGSYVDLSTQEFIVNNELTNSHSFALAILFDSTKKPLYKNPLPSELDQTLVKPKKRFTSV